MMYCFEKKHLAHFDHHSESPTEEGAKRSQDLFEKYFMK